MARRKRRLRWVRPHQFQPDVVTDWRGRPYCICGKPEPNRVHKVRPLDPHVRVVTARIMGERIESENQ